MPDPTIQPTTFATISLRTGRRRLTTHLVPGKGSSGHPPRPVRHARPHHPAPDPNTWPAFAALVERHGGIFGGCWCVGFHACGLTRDPAANRATKEALVRQGRAHAALVMEGEACLG